MLVVLDDKVGFCVYSGIRYTPPRIYGISAGGGIYGISAGCIRIRKRIQVERKAVAAAASLRKGYCTSFKIKRKVSLNHSNYIKLF